MPSTPGVNRALLAAAWGLTAGISGCLLVHSSDWHLLFNTIWCVTSVVGAVACAVNVNNELWCKQTKKAPGR